MAIDDLPGPVVNFLNVIGAPWPYIDEDTVSQFATLARGFGQAVQTTHQDAMENQPAWTLPVVELRITGPGLDQNQVSSMLSTEPTKVWSETAADGSLIHGWSLASRGHAADIAEQEIGRIVAVVERNIESLRRLHAAGAVPVVTVQGYVGDGSSVRFTPQEVRALAAGGVTLRVTGSTSDR